MFVASAKKLAKNPQNRQAQNELTDTSEKIKVYDLFLDLLQKDGSPVDPPECSISNGIYGRPDRQPGDPSCCSAVLLPMHRLVTSLLRFSQHSGQGESSKMQDAAKAGNKEAVADAAKRLQRANIKLAKQARAKAIRIEDPVKRRELLAAIDEMDRLLPEQLSAASGTSSWYHT